LQLNTVWLPDVVIFLDLSPELAVTRIKTRRQKIDHHENLADLGQAREMYLKTLDAFGRYRSPEAAHRLEIDDLTLGETIQAVIETIKPELESRLASGRELCIFTAPSGFAYDLFRPLEEIAGRDADTMKRVHIIAADLDPHGVLESNLTERSKRLGIRLTFLRGDLT